MQFYIHASAGALLVTWLMSMFHGCEKNFLPIFALQVFEAASKTFNSKSRILLSVAVSCIDFDFKI